MNFISLMGRRVRTLGLYGGQKRGLLNWGSERKVALRMSRSIYAAAVAARARDAALPSDPVVRRLVSRSPARGGLSVVVSVLQPSRSLSSSECVLVCGVGSKANNEFMLAKIRG